MMTLSIRQPWASLIARGIKTLEVRCWSTNYRGPVLIVAGGRHWGKRKLRALPNPVPIEDGPRGVTLCVVDLVDVRVARSEDEGRALVKPGETDFVWQFENPRPVPQVPCRGRLGLYPADETTRHAIGVK